MLEMTTVAACRACDWTSEGPKADRAAEKHTADTGHATATRTNLSIVPLKKRR